MSRLRLATVFSGIGSIEHALMNRKIEYELVFACDTGERYLTRSFEEISEEIRKSNVSDIKAFINGLYDKEKKPNYVKQTYFANYEIDESKWYSDIRFIDGTKYTNKVDLLVGGSPCQSFSIMGNRAGLEDTRGTLFYDFARLISEIKPKAFIFENVPGMLAHDKGNTWKVIKEVFSQLDYKLSCDVLNSLDYGIPQNRKRLFVVGVLDKNVDFKFPKESIPLESINSFLEDNNLVEPHHYLGKKGFEFVTNPKYKNRARIIKDIISTQKANQQFNWNGDFIFVESSKITNDQIHSRGYEGTYLGKKGYIRQLTNRECFNLMGYNERFRIVVPKMQAYRQAGNSIVVNVVENIVIELMKVLGL